MNERIKPTAKELARCAFYGLGYVGLTAGLWNAYKAHEDQNAFQNHFDQVTTRPSSDLGTPHPVTSEEKQIFSKLRFEMDPTFTLLPKTKLTSNQEFHLQAGKDAYDNYRTENANAWICGFGTFIVFIAAGAEALSEQYAKRNKLNAS